MSRIGKLAIKIPADVQIRQQNSKITITGKFGELSQHLPESLLFEESAGILKISAKVGSTNIKNLFGLYRSLINNMIFGVSEKFTLTLILHGIGYRSVIDKDHLILNLGYSHIIKLIIPVDIHIEITKNTILKLTSCNKEKLGEFGATIRAWRSPEPYKGKGVHYEREVVTKKSGKTAKSIKK